MLTNVVLCLIYSTYFIYTHAHIYIVVYIVRCTHHAVLLINDNEEDEDSGWVPYLTINHSEITDGETKETSIN